MPINESKVEDLRGVFLDLDFFWADDADYLAVFIGNEYSAENSHHGLAVHFLLAPDTELSDELLLSVCNQRERQLIFGYEFFVRRLVLDAHSDDHIAQREEALIVVPNVASLRRASGSAVLRINI